MAPSVRVSEVCIVQDSHMGRTQLLKHIENCQHVSDLLKCLKTLPLMSFIKLFTQGAGGGGGGGWGEAGGRGGGW